MQLCFEVLNGKLLKIELKNLLCNFIVKFECITLILIYKVICPPPTPPHPTQKNFVT